VVVEAQEAELLVLKRWSEFHRETLGFAPCWGTYARAELQRRKWRGPDCRDTAGAAERCNRGDVRDAIESRHAARCFWAIADYPTRPSCRA
jgi:hypothetical protein